MRLPSQRSHYRCTVRTCRFELLLLLGKQLKQHNGEYQSRHYLLLLVQNCFYSAVITPKCNILDLNFLHNLRFPLISSHFLLKPKLQSTISTLLAPGCFSKHISVFELMQEIPPTSATENKCMFKT